MNPIPLRHKLTSSLLFDHSINFIAVIHVKLIWGLVSLDTVSVVQEADGSRGDTETVAISIHQLLQIGGALDLEEDFIAVSSLNLQVEVLGFLFLFSHGANNK